MSDDFIYDEEESFRDSLATVDKDGKRIWIYPKKPKGRFYDYRKWLSYALLLILFGAPWLKCKGQPLFLFNFLEGKFILFGVFFGPQDTYLFVIAMLIIMIFVVLFTVIFGRLFCGWICPQTIFMEMVYRRIEYWIEGDYTAQMRLDKSPWNFDKTWRKLTKHFIFFVIAVFIANTFLAYIIGIDEVLSIIKEPINAHKSGFMAMIIFSFVFYYVFARLREQVCTTICPYGRLQGVLLDKNSLAVQYDFVRGEPRGRIKKNESITNDRGDCIDCTLCVKVCPTGIDIRNGIQLECVNCTACMDVCDEVMVKINRPTGLIRMDSLVGITDNTKKLINRRSVAYSIVLLVLIIIEGFLFTGRSKVEVLLLRTPGLLYQAQEDNRISNLYNYQLVNKTDQVISLVFKIDNLESATIEYVGENPKTIPQGVAKGALFIKIPRSVLNKSKTQISLKAYSEDGEFISAFKTNFMGPG